MTAAEASSSTGIEVRSRVRSSTYASERTILDLLAGYAAERSPVAPRIRAALAAQGVDLDTIPLRTPAELRDWKRDRQPRCKECSEKDTALAEAQKLALPEGYVLEQCDCGAEYPRDTKASVGRCPRCWWRHADKLERELGETRAEVEGLRQSVAEAPVPIRVVK